MKRHARHALPLAVVLWLLPGGLQAQEEIFERGNQLYQEGDFAGALAAYDAVRSAGYQRAELHYNLGNAYFKVGELGRSILERERALTLSPRDPDALANLELARSLTADAVEPLPRFWLVAALSWWVGLLPRGLLLVLVGGAWLAVGACVSVRIASRRPEVGRWATRLGVVAGAVVVVFGINLAVRELGLGLPERAVVLVEVVPVRSAPADDDDLTLFEIHEGTRVRVDQRAGVWAEVVLDDGQVGWVPVDAMESI